MITSTGISQRLTRSMPRCTPPATMNVVAPSIAACQAIG